jgi:hypothetical protein
MLDGGHSLIATTCRREARSTPDLCPSHDEVEAAELSIFRVGDSEEEALVEKCITPIPGLAGEEQLRGKDRSGGSLHLEMVVPRAPGKRTGTMVVNHHRPPSSMN